MGADLEIRALSWNWETSSWREIVKPNIAVRDYEVFEKLVGNFRSKHICNPDCKHAPVTFEGDGVSGNILLGRLIDWLRNTPFDSYDDEEDLYGYYDLSLKHRFKSVVLHEIVSVLRDREIPFDNVRLEFEFWN
jgi:hypothetical protein